MSVSLLRGCHFHTYQKANIAASSEPDLYFNDQLFVNALRAKTAEQKEVRCQFFMMSFSFHKYQKATLVCCLGYQCKDYASYRNHRANFWLLFTWTWAWYIGCRLAALWCVTVNTVGVKTLNAEDVFAAVTFCEAGQSDADVLSQFAFSAQNLLESVVATPVFV